MNNRKQMEKYNNIMFRMNEMYAIFAKSIGMSYNSMMVLYALNQSSPCTQKFICTSLLIPKQTANTILKAFEKSGIVTLVSEGSREKTIAFTESGKIFAEEKLAPLYAIEDKMLDTLQPKKIKKFIDNNQKMLDILEQEVLNGK